MQILPLHSRFTIPAFSLLYTPSRLRYCFTAYTTLPYPMYYYIA